MSQIYVTDAILVYVDQTVVYIRVHSVHVVCVCMFCFAECLIHLTASNTVYVRAQLVILFAIDSFLSSVSSKVTATIIFYFIPVSL